MAEITQKQLEANRRNALKSTGPRTPEGQGAGGPEPHKTRAVIERGFACQ